MFSQVMLLPLYCLRQVKHVASSYVRCSVVCRHAPGFDNRVSNLNGALGAGTYFAQHVSYSLGYVDKVRFHACACIQRMQVC